MFSFLFDVPTTSNILSNVQEEHSHYINNSEKQQTSIQCVAVLSERRTIGVQNEQFRRRRKPIDR